VVDILATPTFPRSEPPAIQETQIHAHKCFSLKPVAVLYCFCYFGLHSGPELGAALAACAAVAIRTGSCPAVGNNGGQPVAFLLLQAVAAAASLQPRSELPAVPSTENCRCSFRFLRDEARANR